MKLSKTKKFLKEHPVCCYCGGEEPSETIDHRPSRAMFVSRQYPPPLEFPACEACNTNAEDLDVIFAYVIRQLSEETFTTEDAKRIRWRMRAKFPELMIRVAKSPIEIRRILRDRGIKKDSNTLTTDYPIAAISADIFPYLDDAADLLCKALFYRETKTIFPQSGRIFSVTMFCSNSQQNTQFNNLVRENLINLRIDLPQKPFPKNQFRYNCGFNDDIGLFSYWARFADVFECFSIACRTPEKLSSEMLKELFE